MSQAVDLVKEAGPYLVGLGGLAFGYINARSPGREARHHTRVEALYQDMLDDLENRHTSIVKRIGFTEWGALPARDPATYQVTSARVRLYASPSVAQRWADAHGLLLNLGAQHNHALEDSAVANIWMMYKHAEEALVEAMRSDLGVRPSARQRLAVQLHRPRRMLYRWLRTHSIKRSIKAMMQEQDTGAQAYLETHPPSTARPPSETTEDPT